MKIEESKSSGADEGGEVDLQGGTSIASAALELSLTSISSATVPVKKKILSSDVDGEGIDLDDRATYAKYGRPVFLWSGNHDFDYYTHFPGRGPPDWMTPQVWLATSSEGDGTTKSFQSMRVTGTCPEQSKSTPVLQSRSRTLSAVASSK